MAKNKNKPTKETIEMDKSDEVLVEVKKNKKDILLVKLLCVLFLYRVIWHRKI